MLPKIANSPKELNQILNKFEWSCIVNNKKVEDTRENWNKYRILFPEQFLELRAGCCWDYCNFQSEYFDEYFPEIEYKLLFMVDSEESNHTFMTYVENNKLKLFESSYKEYIGIYEFTDEREIIDFFVNKMKISHYNVYTYNKMNSYGISADNFIEYILNEGKLVLSK